MLVSIRIYLKTNVLLVNGHWSHTLALFTNYVFWKRLTHGRYCCKFSPWNFMIIKPNRWNFPYREYWRSLRIQHLNFGFHKPIVRASVNIRSYLKANVSRTEVGSLRKLFFFCEARNTLPWPIGNNVFKIWHVSGWGCAIYSHEKLSYTWVTKTVLREDDISASARPFDRA